MQHYGVVEFRFSVMVIVMSKPLPLSLFSGVFLVSDCLLVYKYKRVLQNNVGMNRIIYYADIRYS